MVGGILGGEDDVLRQCAVVGNGEALQGEQRLGGGHRLRDRADAADPRRIDQGVKRILAGQDLLEAAIERRVDEGGAHFAGLDLQPDLQIAFDAIERADDTTAHALVFPCRPTGGTTIRSATAFLRRRSGVAAFDNEASATNQAFGMSVGSPTGMPARLGVCR